MLAEIAGKSIHFRRMPFELLSAVDIGSNSMEMFNVITCYAQGLLFKMVRVKLHCCLDIDDPKFQSKEGAIVPEYKFNHTRK